MSDPRSTKVRPTAVSVPAPLALEAGVEFLMVPGWLPPPIEPCATLEAVHEGQMDACLARVSLEGEIGGNIVERLAAAYGLLHLKRKGRSDYRSRVMWETLEALGYEVSTAFPERGSDAYQLFRTICELEKGTEFDPMSRDLAYQCLGRLWASAHSAPHGYAHYIAESLSGGERPDLSFFHPLTRPEEMRGQVEARFMRRMTDLLQASVFAARLPNCTVGERRAPPLPMRHRWDARIARDAMRSVDVKVHFEVTTMGEEGRRFDLALIDRNTHLFLGRIQATVLEGDSGSYDDFIDLASRAGSEVELCVDSVFAADQVVTLYPRVRELLDAADHRLFRLLVIEEIYAEPHARGWQCASILLSQLLVATDMVDLAIMRPTPFPVPESMRAQFAVQAAYARARLRLAALFTSLGAEYLLSGTMGFRISALQKLYAQGKGSLADGFI